MNSKLFRIFYLKKDTCMENYFKVTNIIKKKKNSSDKSHQEKLFWSLQNNFFQVTDFKINQTQAQQLHNIVLKSANYTKNIMNLFIQGGRGCGKYTLARYYIYLYTEIELPALNLETIKYESKELEYFRGSKHCELVIYKYNFNDTNLINQFFNTVCHDTTHSQITNKKIIIIRNIDNMRRENLYLIKYYIEKYSSHNAFIFLSSKSIPIELVGFFTNIRVSLPTEKELYELGKSLMKTKEITAKNSDLKKIAKQANKNITHLKNLMELSYLSGKYHEIVESDNSKFLYLYKLLKKKNIKTILLIRELLTDLVTENISSQEILTYLLNRFLKSKNVSHSEKAKIVDIIVQADLKDIRSFRNIIHLECACVQIINVF